MARPYPTLGFPSRSAAIAHLASQGLSNIEIARRVKIPASKVPGSLWHTKMDKKELRARRAALRETRRNVVLDKCIYDLLVPHAAKRGVTTGDLVRGILAIVATEPVIIDNILDDGVGHDKE